MEKNTVLAIILSLVVIVGYYFVMTIVNPPKPPQIIPQKEAQTEQTAPESSGTSSQNGSSTASVMGQGSSDGLDGVISTRPRRVGNIPQKEELFTIKTDIIEATFSNVGGTLTSFKLLKHDDGNEPVDMIMRGENEARAFDIAFGGRDARADTSLFNVSEDPGNAQAIGNKTITFTADYELQGRVFTLTKKYEFVQGEYMFKLDINIDGGDSIPALAFPTRNGNFSYTLEFGPQIGPKFAALDERQDYRHYLARINGKLKDQKVNDNTDAVIDDSITWAAIAGKYFTLIAVIPPPPPTNPVLTKYEYVFSMLPRENGIPSASRLFIERPPLSASTQNDVFYFYLGPKTPEALEIYDTNKTQFGTVFEGYELSKAANAGGFWAILSPLEWILKQLLTMFYFLIPNYGVAIILVTVLIKLLLFPLTKKQSEGTLRMQAIAPKIKELQEKYKDNPQKLNGEMAALYKKEGYNPLSGCLPLLIQFPIFIAMYNLFNNHFDLRGAEFIAGWIPDLSLPEYIWSFAPFKIPILGWSELRLLPFIYVGSQLLYSKITSTPDQAANQQMKMMMYFMPIIFFFILYNVPSGLLVYWIMSNVLQMVQQLFINKYLSKKRAAIQYANDAQKKVIVPPKKRKRR